MWYESPSFSARPRIIFPPLFSARPIDESYTSFLYILAACGAVLVLIMLASILFCLCRRMKKKERKEAFKANIKTNPLELNALIPKYQIHSHVPEIDLGNLRFLDVMGDGNFGKVYAGDLTTDGCTKVVIIRMLKEASNAKAKQDFQREVGEKQGPLKYSMALQSSTFAAETMVGFPPSKCGNADRRPHRTGSAYFDI